MIVSTKGRYALRVMVCFAQRGGNEYIPLKEIAESEGISQKYLESIVTTLSKAGFVDAVHGKGGGYRLNRPPEEYTIGSRSLTRANITELRNLRDELSAEVAAENADANLFGRTYTAFFVGTGR